MKPLKIAATIMLASFFVLTYLLYLNWNKIVIFGDNKHSSLVITTSSNDHKTGIPMHHMPLNEVYPDLKHLYSNDSYEIEEEKPGKTENSKNIKSNVSTDPKNGFQEIELK